MVFSKVIKEVVSVSSCLTIKYMQNSVLVYIIYTLPSGDAASKLIVKVFTVLVDR